MGLGGSQWVWEGLCGSWRVSEGLLSVGGGNVGVSGGRGGTLVSVGGGGTLVSGLGVPGKGLGGAPDILFSRRAPRSLSLPVGSGRHWESIMAKSKNHTTHNQSRKWHRTASRNPDPRDTSLSRGWIPSS
ncbi:large ribosomal subunit protein eL29 [Lithobates pipiens]